MGHWGLLVWMPFHLHWGVQQFRLDVNFRLLTDNFVRAIGVYEATASLVGQAGSSSMDGPWPGLVSWGPWMHFNCQERIDHGMAPEQM